MSGNNLFADTNILLHILNGSCIVEPYSDAFFIISFVTEIKTLCHQNLNPNKQPKKHLICSKNFK